MRMIKLIHSFFLYRICTLFNESSWLLDPHLYPLSNIFPTLNGKGSPGVDPTFPCFLPQNVGFYKTILRSYYLFIRQTHPSYLWLNESWSLTISRSWRRTYQEKSLINHKIRFLKWIPIPILEDHKAIIIKLHLI